MCDRTRASKETRTLRRERVVIGKRLFKRRRKRRRVEVASNLSAGRGFPRMRVTHLLVRTYLCMRRETASDSVQTCRQMPWQVYAIRVCSIRVHVSYGCTKVSESWARKTVNLERDISYTHHIVFRLNTHTHTCQHNEPEHARALCLYENSRTFRFVSRRSRTSRGVSRNGEE